MMLTRSRPRRAVAAVAAIATGLVVPATAAHAKHIPARAPISSAVALQWYDITSQTVAAGAFPEPVTQSRVWAVAWSAAAGAVGAGRDPVASTAAFASALHDALAAQVPSQQSTLDDDLAATLASIPSGARKTAGVRAGQEAAASILAARAGDGLDTASVDVAWSPPPAGPGVWQPTPPTFGPAVRAGEGNAKPFLLKRHDQFRAAPPPALDSSAYLTALAEVRSVGRATSTVRTPEQTDVARFWAQNSVDAYVQVLRSLIAGSPHSLAWAAQLVALFHVVTVDAQIAIYDTKYAYGFWRPVTAIRTGAVNPDPSWTPLITTPRHPEYVSGHAGYAGAAEHVLRAFFGPQAPFPIAITSSTDPGVTHTFTTWSAITQENIDGRVWEGIHFRFSDVTGAQLGRTVADYDLGRLSLG